MKITFLPVLVLALFLAGCATKALPPVQINIPTHTIDYQKEVKPLLDKRCTVCHSCYNSPCQLKMDSFEGTDRGASKQAVYNSQRLTAMDPTRLFTDAQSTEGWRKKGFFSVTESTVTNGLNDSLMIQLLSHKMKNPKSTGEYSSGNRRSDLFGESERGLAGYLKKHPNRGMPYGFPPSSRKSSRSLPAGWRRAPKAPMLEQQAELANRKPVTPWPSTSGKSFSIKTMPSTA